MRNVDSNNNSFPSGHTAMGWMGLPFLFYVKKQNIKKLLRKNIENSLIDK